MICRSSGRIEERKRGFFFHRKNFNSAEFPRDLLLLNDGPYRFEHFRRLNVIGKKQNEDICPSLPFLKFQF